MKAVVVPKVSVIIPTYNAALFLERAVESVLIQEGFTVEIIIVDNNSTDNTKEIAAQYEAAYPEVVKLFTELIQGASSARNRGLREAKGEWIQFLDADDFLLSGKIARQLSLITDEVGWVVGTSVPWADGETGEPFKIAEDPWASIVFCSGSGDTNGNLFRRSELERVGAFDVNMVVGEDYELYFRLLKAGVGRAKDLEVGTCYVQHAGYRGEGRGWEARQKFRHYFVGQILAYLQAEQPEYYGEKTSTWVAAEVAAIRMYMSADYSGGAAIFAQRFPDSVNWNELPADRLPGYWRYYGVLGFCNLEGLRVGGAKLLPQSLKSGVSKLLGR